ncbi:unnamed protein product [Heligmosomoides polygyrus]|uniref:Uncharacterized protein n=1 Tax=Heligmosomoides polygyrus TaxID=6339 RepID=A0A183FPG8_HELPZ|nr:unnamed protein product [Heligmosomoides polygyrus]
MATATTMTRTKWKKKTTAQRRTRRKRDERRRLSARRSRHRRHLARTVFSSLVRSHSARAQFTDPRSGFAPLIRVG